MTVKAIPHNYPPLMCYLAVNGASDALAFYARAFGAKERYRLVGPGGGIAHAEVELGNGILMVSDEFPDWGALSPKTIGGTPVTIVLMVDDVDAIFAKAVAEGATALSPPQDHFYGDRACSLLDPFGHKWHIATHIEDVAPEEMQRRMNAMGA